MDFIKEVTSINIPSDIQPVIESVLEKKAEDVVVLDLRELTTFTDYFIICTGESEPQIKSIFKQVDEKMSSLGRHFHHVEGRAETGWILMDYDDFIVHIFLPDKRMFYELERLWADARRHEVVDSVPARFA